MEHEVSICAPGGKADHSLERVVLFACIYIFIDDRTKTALKNCEWKQMLKLSKYLSIKVNT